MNGYVCFGPNGKRMEVYADTQYQASCKAAQAWKIPANKTWKVSSHLAEKDGAPVVHVTTE